MNIQFQQVIPVLRIFDEAKAREFYLDFLGFSLLWEHRFDANAPIYMGVERASLTLHLSEHHGDCIPGACIHVNMIGIHAYQQELLAKRYKYYRPGVEETFYGTWCMEVIDPFGNKIRFNEELAAGSQNTA